MEGEKHTERKAKEGYSGKHIQSNRERDSRRRGRRKRKRQGREEREHAHWGVAVQQVLVW